MVVLEVVENGGEHTEVSEVVYTGAEELEVGCVGTDDRNQG